MPSTLFSVPNLLTLFRIFIIPIFVLLFYLPFQWSRTAAATLFAFAALTDWLDGYLARKLKAFSALGEFLDPVADKLLVAVALVLLTQANPQAYLAIPAAVIICREIVVSALREWMAELGRRAHVAVSAWGKWKTALQLIAITMLLALDPKSSPLTLRMLGYVFLYIAVFLTLWSMTLYLRAAWQDLQNWQDTRPL
ncbi:MAG: CDP-diacylglycerol--glycerol-3-phosphate 3-phosphatidyltransferase [Gammaproteobacteria bacterium]